MWIKTVAPPTYKDWWECAALSRAQRDYIDGHFELEEFEAMVWAILTDPQVAADYGAVGGLPLERG